MCIFYEGNKMPWKFKISKGKGHDINEVRSKLQIVFHIKLHVILKSVLHGFLGKY